MLGMSETGSDGAGAGVRTGDSEWVSDWTLNIVFSTNNVDLVDANIYYLHKYDVAWYLFIEDKWSFDLILRFKAPTASSVDPLIFSSKLIKQPKLEKL